MWSLVRVSGWQTLISGFPGLWSKGCRLVAFIRFYAAELALKHLVQDTGRCRGACIHGRKVRLCLNARVVGLACIMRHTAHSASVACSRQMSFSYLPFPCVSGAPLAASLGRAIAPGFVCQLAHIRCEVARWFHRADAQLMSAASRLHDSRGALDYSGSTEQLLSAAVAARDAEFRPCMMRQRFSACRA